MALTISDLKAIKQIVGQSEKRIKDDLSKVLIKNYVTKYELKEAVDELKEEIRLLPTRDEFLTKMDEIMGELKIVREEQTMLSYRVSTHSDEILALQDIHPHGKHTLAV